LFDFIRFCEQHDIPYVTKGVNKKVSDDCNISCPFCNEGPDPDPSKHLGVNSELGVYSCWRNPIKHRGRTLHKLIMKLLRCSYADARTILGQQPLWLKEGQFELFAEDPTSLFVDKHENAAVEELTFPEEFRTFESKFSSEERFVNYLVDRGFYRGRLRHLYNRYNLRWAVSGRYKNRIIIPNTLDGHLVNWTSRSIEKNQTVRYLTLSDEQGALVNIKKMIFNWDSLVESPSSLVVVCEGPVDALKIDFYGHFNGLRATCLFSQLPTKEQLAYIAALSDLYDGVVVMLDDTAQDLAESLVDQLSWLPIRCHPLPLGVHDPGELTDKQVYELGKQLNTFMMDLIMEKPTAKKVDFHREWLT
jgi:hypothetical protein